MKRRIFKLAIVTCFILAVTALFTVSSSADTYGDLAYTVSGGEVTITGCNTSVTSVTIPSTINGYPVTSIGYEAFWDCSSLTSISIPDSVTSIGDYAFENCTSLTSISIPDSVTSIGYRAFEDCTKLTSVNIPDSVTSIGSDAFDDCTSLKYNNYENGKYLGNSNNPYVALIDTISTGFTSFTIHPNTKVIYSYAFDNCTSLTSISIPDSVTIIGGAAFQNCTSLTSVNIPDSVTSIGSDPFSGCTSLKYNNYENGKYLGNSNNPYVALIDTISTGFTSFTIHPNTKVIYSYAFEDCTSLTSISIPDSVTSIGSSAFSQCTSLTSVNIPDSVTSIGDYAFYECTRLTSVSIPDSVTSIGDLAFYNCKSLTSVNIPDSVTSIGEDAFRDCTSIKSVSIPDSVTNIGSYAFSGCTGLTRVDITDISAWCNLNFSYKYSNPLYYAENLYLNGTLVTDLVIGNDVKSIGPYAFINCVNLTSISIPNSVTDIEIDAFNGCINLTRVDITDITAWCNINFEFSYSNPLRYAKNLYLNGKLVTELSLPQGITKVGSYAFAGCTSLTSISIPDSVTSIGIYAFYNCTSLTSISIPDSVTSIGYDAFYNCTSLTSVYYNAENVADLSSGNDVFSYAGQSGEGIKVTIGKDVKHIPAYLFCSYSSSSYSPKITEVVFEEGSVCESIGRSAFEDCTRLTSISIPDSVTSIGYKAFYICWSLTSISIPNSVTSIGDYAFSGCSKLNTVYYCGTAAEWNGISIGSYNTPLTNATREYHKCTWTTTTEPTCTEDGIETEFCEFCGEAKGQATLPALGHKYTWTTTEPTCTEDGIETEFCEFCGKVDSVVLPALGHRVVCEALVDAIKTENDTAYPFSLSDGVYSSTNKADSSKSTFTITALYDCTLKLEYSVSSESKYDKLIISKNGTALYTKSGVVSWTAVEIELKAGDKLAISYSKDSSQSKNADTGYFKFSCDQVHVTDIIPADKLEPTCRDAVICSYCNEVVKPIAPSNHTYSEWYVKTAPACTEEGVEERICTNNCGFAETRAIPATGHSMGDWHVKTAPACTEEGVEERKCTNNCGFAETRAIPATGHSIGEWYVTTPATCTEEGVEERICTNNCGLAETRAIPATGHSMGDWHVKTAPACTEEGVEERKCTNNCGFAETRAIPATGHTWGEWHVKTASTCTEEGVEERKCTKNCGFAETRAIPTTEHTWGEWYSVVAHTCTAPGLERRVCSVCSKQENKVVPASHTYGDWYATTPATCTAEGVERRDCTACTNYETNTIPILPHSEVSHSAKAPTCTDIGWNAYVTCSKCDYTTYEEIPATGHSYSDWNILAEPTPESAGFRSKVCSACGDEVFEMILFASGDVDGDGTLTNADLTVAVRAISGWNIEGNVALIDVNYDGKYNNRDIIAFIKKLAGID